MSLLLAQLLLNFLLVSPLLPFRKRFPVALLPSVFHFTSHIFNNFCNSFRCQSFNQSVSLSVSVRLYDCLSVWLAGCLFMSVCLSFNKQTDVVTTKNEQTNRRGNNYRTLQKKDKEEIKEHYATHYKTLSYVNTSKASAT